MNLSTLKRAVVAGATVLAMAAFASPAKANTVIDFGTGVTGNTGIFGLLPGGNAFGVNIDIGVMTVSGAPANNGTYVIPTGDALLNFNTVANTITITDNGGQGFPGGPTLLTGSFLSWNASATGLANAIGPDRKDSTLLAFLGLPANTPFTYFGFSLTSANSVTCPPNSGATQCWSVGSTDIRNSSVPEPGSLMLLGTGLLGLGGAIRRRFGR